MADHPPTPKRLQTQTERDLASPGRRERVRSAPRGVPIGEFEDGPVTGNYEGDELAAMRAQRPIEKRISRIEQKQDADREDLKELTRSVAATREDVAAIKGELKVLPELVSLIKGSQETERQGMAGRTKIILAVISLLATGLGILGGAAMGGCS